MGTRTGYIGVYREYSITRVNMGTRTGYIGVYRVYSITRVNMGTLKIYSGIQGIRDNIRGSLYGDCHELLATVLRRNKNMAVEFGTVSQLLYFGNSQIC